MNEAWKARADRYLAINAWLKKVRPNEGPQSIMGMIQAEEKAKR